MDIIKFLNPTHPLLFDQAVVVQGIKSKMWIERYRDTGEFQLVAPTYELVQNNLPIGSFISHLQTDEIMIVENHEIKEENNKEDEVTITGRSFESFLENRIVGRNKVWPTVASAGEEYILPAMNTWQQALKLIKDHTDPLFTIDDDDALYNVEVVTNVPGSGVQEERSVKRGTVHERLIELLSIERIGIKAVRPGATSPFGLENTRLALLIHAGLDLTEQVAFSYNTGEIESADYLWSNKRLKNSALVTSKWFEIAINNGPTGYERRTMFIDASDIDSGWQDPPPVGPDRDLVLFYMWVRGQMTLYQQREIALFKTEPSKDSQIYKYRTHYNVGDIITIKGNYNTSSAMRVTEYVEIEDEYGQSGYPTLSSP